MDKPSDKPATLYCENEPVVKQSAYDALQTKLDEAVEQTTKMREACADYPRMVDEAFAQRDTLKAKLDEATRLLAMANVQLGQEYKESYWPAWKYQYDKWKGLR